MSFIDSVFRAVEGLYGYFRLFVLRAILFFTQCIEYRTLPRRLSEATRLVLLIGDGTAEGVGDNLGRTGLTSSLNALLREKQDELHLRLLWRVMSAGRLYSTSEEWLPGSKLFRRTFEKGQFRHATVVVVVLGMHDDLSAGAGAPGVTNIIRIVDSLLDMDKAVVVPLLPNMHPRNSPAFIAAAEASRALRQSLLALADKRKDVALAFDSDMSKTCALGGGVLVAENHFCAFNSRGYRLLAADVLDDIIAVVKKVEWSHWKERLAGR